MEEHLTQYARVEDAITKLNRKLRQVGETIQKFKGKLKSVEKLISEKGSYDETKLLNRITDEEENYAEIRQELDRVPKVHDEQQKINDTIKKNVQINHRKLLKREA